MLIYSFNWRIITSQHYDGFCHTSTWITNVHSFLNLPPNGWQHGMRQVALKYIGFTNPDYKNFGFQLDKFQHICEPQSPHLKEVMIYSTLENYFWGLLVRLGTLETKGVTHKRLAPSVRYPNCIIYQNIGFNYPLVYDCCIVMIRLRYLSLENQDRMI